MSDGIQQISNGVRLFGETLLPGTSLLMDGRIKEGALHTVAGLAARSLLGPIGWGLVAANSYVKSVSDQNLIGLATEYANDAKNALKRAAKTEDTNVVDAEIVEIVEADKIIVPENEKESSAAKGASAKA